MRPSGRLRHRRVSATFLLLTFTAACTDNAEPTGPGISSATEAAPLLGVVNTSLARMVITPRIDTIVVGDSISFMATGYLDSQVVDVSQYVVWESTDATVATVSLTGKLRARAAGRVSVIASTRQFSDTSVVFVRNTGGAVTPPRPPAPLPPPAPVPAPPAPAPVNPAPTPSNLRGAVAPNMPAGFNIYSSRNFQSRASSSHDYAGSQGWEPSEWRNPNLVRMSDASAFGSGPSIMRYIFPAGLRSGSGPASTRYLFKNKSARSMYVATWVRFSPNFSIGGNKIYYVNWTGGSFVMFVNETGGVGDGPLRLELRVNHSAFQYGNIGTGRVLQRGQWHLVELALGLSSNSNSPDGSVRIWVDGALAVSRPGLRIPGTPPFIEVRYSPIYGGINSAPVATSMWMDLDHVQIGGQ